MPRDAVSYFSYPLTMYLLSVNYCLSCYVYSFLKDSLKRWKYFTVVWFKFLLVFLFFSLLTDGLHNYKDSKNMVLNCCCNVVTNGLEFYCYFFCFCFYDLVTKHIGFDVVSPLVLSNLAISILLYLWLCDFLSTEEEEDMFYTATKFIFFISSQIVKISQNIFCIYIQ